MFYNQWCCRLSQDKCQARQFARKSSLRVIELKNPRVLFSKCLVVGKSCGHQVQKPGKCYKKKQVESVFDTLKNQYVPGSRLNELLPLDQIGRSHCGQKQLRHFFGQLSDKIVVFLLCPKNLSRVSRSKFGHCAIQFYQFVPFVFVNSINMV